MVKLTPDLIAQTAQFTNAVRDRELDLRGFRIPTIENLGATLDQFDTIDFSDNDIRKLDGFPLLRRLKCLLLNNNRIMRIGDQLEVNLPNLEAIILTNNNIQELGDIDCLASVKTLTTLSLMRNPVSRQKHYRLYVIHRLPQLRLLDFQKIKLKEKEAAAALFKGSKGAQLAKELGKKTKTFTPGVGLPAAAAGKPEGRGVATAGAAAAAGGSQKQDIEAIKLAIANAKTLDEVEHLTHLLQSGVVPGREGGASGSASQLGEENGATASGGTNGDGDLEESMEDGHHDDEDDDDDAPGGGNRHHDDDGDDNNDDDDEGDQEDME